MSNKKPIAASDLPEAKIQSKFIVDGDHLEAPQEGAAVQTMTTAELWTKACAEGGEALLDHLKNALFLSSLRIRHQLLAYRCGWLPLLDKLQRLPGAGVLPAAAGSLVKYWRPLNSVIPGALVGFSISGVQDLLDRLLFITEVREVVATLDARLLAVQTQIEVALDKPVRAIYNRGAALIESHEDLSGPLAPMTEYVKGAAFRAADSRRGNERRDEKIANALDREAASQPQAPAAPQTPPVVIIAPPAAAIAAPVAPAPRKPRTRS